MRFDSAEEVLSAIVHAYYDERNIEGTLDCVTDDIEWIGTENNDSAYGKENLKKLLIQDVISYPDSFPIEIQDPVAQVISDDVVLFTVVGKQVVVPEVIGGFTVRGTMCCVHTAAGWLVKNVHTSVPNAELEKYSLSLEVEDTKRREQALLASIPGGIAIYRIKKDGRVKADYISKSLAKMCGYTTQEFLAIMKKDATSVIVPEDIPAAMTMVQDCIDHDKQIRTMYRIYTKNKEEMLIRMDANRITSEALQDDDVAVFYAVHSPVSDASKKIIQEQKLFTALLNQVPAGIGIFEVDHGVASQIYMNDAFYNMLSSEREDREKYLGTNTMNAAHPEDAPKIKALMQKLLAGDSNGSISYRLRINDNHWFWVHLAVTVVERRENYVKVYAALSDYNKVVAAEQEAKTDRETLRIALQSANVLAWQYDYRIDRITDSSILGEVIGAPKVIDHVYQFALNSGCVAKESIAEFNRLYEGIKTEKTVSADIKVFLQHDKTVTWRRFVFTPIFDNHGNYVNAIGISVDITEHKQREQEYQEQLRLIQLSNKDALSRVFLNLSKNSVTSYESMAPEFDYHAKFHTVDEILASAKADFSDPEEVKKFEIVADCKHMMDLFKEGQTHVEIRTHQQAKTKWQQVSYDMVKNPYTGDIEAICSVHDVTSLVHAQQVTDQLLNVEYQSVLLIDVENGEFSSFLPNSENDILNAIMNFQSDGRNIELGLANFFEKYAVPGTAEQAIQENSLRTIQQQLSKLPIYEPQYVLLKNGVKSYYRILYSYLDHDPSVILCAVQNITTITEQEHRQQEELKKAIEEANTANKAKTSFLSRVSHDMRTPLNGILGLTEILKDNVHDTAMASDLEDLELSGKYLLNLINDTLDMSRIESGNLELHPIVCEGRAFFNNAIALAKSAIEAKGIHYQVSCGDLPFTILYDDVARMEQVILNIVSNAVKFTPKDGNIKITVKNVGFQDGVIIDQIIISDDGIGMSAEYIPHMFDAFSQEDATRTSTTQGTGLGMAITKQLLKLMDGDIDVESELGKGTSVTLTMKLHKATKEQIEQWKSSQFIKNTDTVLSGKRILLCEDHPLNAKIAIKILETKDIIVEHADNGQVGVSMFTHSAQGYYDAIFMDIRMPVMDGIEATKEIRNLSREDAKCIPIIAMTANAFDEDVEQTEKAGMNAHLSKPIQTQVMFSTLSKLLSTNSNE